MVDDPSWSGSADRTGFRVDHRESGSVSVWQADRRLLGVSAVGGLEWQSAATGAYHQTGEFDVALLARGSGSGHSSQPSGMARKYFHLMMRRGRKIAKVAMARRLAIRLYWMWRKGWDYEQVKKFGSHAGTLGTGRGVQ